MSQQSEKTSNERPRLISGRGIVQGVLIALIFVAAGGLILSYQTGQADIIDFQLGQVAPGDVLSPQRLTYVSEVQTEVERGRARNAIPTIDSPPDTGVARKQVSRLRKIFDYLDTVRADPYGSLADKSEWLAAIPDITLSDIIVDQILIIDDEAWASTKQEALAILNQAMRAVIKENQVFTTRRQLPTLVELDTPDNQAGIIVAIVEDLIQPNTFPDDARTEAERTAAAVAIKPIQMTIEQNELIVSGGQIVGPIELEALAALKNSQQAKANPLEDFTAPIVLMLITAIVIGVYLYQYNPAIIADSKRLGLLTFILLTFIVIAKFIIPGNTLFHLYPIAALTIMIAIVIDARLALVLAVLMALIGGYMATDQTQEIVVYLILSGWAGALAMGHSQRVSDLRRAGLYVGLTNIAVIAIFNLPLIETDRITAGLVLFGGVLNVIASVGLAFVGLLMIGSFAGITTSIQLLDLSRPTHPLQRQLLLKAPGTYHHSLMVGNLGEQAAERIDADALLVRVMAYYHDIGKIQRPYFFVENQPEGINVHEKLEPQISAQIIISHVTDGLELAYKYRLPQAIKDGIAQHQGTDLVKYFYYMATKAAEEKNGHVDEKNFRYPGPKPQSKETGILMLADICETSVRALKPGSAEEIDEIVQKMVADKVSSGQLSQCDLTIADLYEIRTAFVDILQGVHHPRIKYPDQIKADETRKEETEAKAKEVKLNQEAQKPTEPVKPENGSTTPPVATPSTQPVVNKTQVKPTPLVRRE